MQRFCIYAHIYLNTEIAYMPHRILTIPFDPVKEVFADEILSDFLINKYVKKIQPEFFQVNGHAYWTVYTFAGSPPDIQARLVPDPSIPCRIFPGDTHHTVPLCLLSLFSASTLPVRLMSRYVSCPDC